MWQTGAARRSGERFLPVTESIAGEASRLKNFFYKLESLESPKFAAVKLRWDRTGRPAPGSTDGGWFAGRGKFGGTSIVSAASFERLLKAAGPSFSDRMTKSWEGRVAPGPSEPTAIDHAASQYRARE